MLQLKQYKAEIKILYPEHSTSTLHYQCFGICNATITSSPFPINTNKIETIVLRNTEVIHVVEKRSDMIRLVVT